MQIVLLNKLGKWTNILLCKIIECKKKRKKISD